MINVRNLTKRYGPRTAIDDVSFDVEDGTICGLLGPNGAGKSTTMNIMTGCLAATSGEVRYDGKEIYADKDTVKRSIGYLPEQPPLYPELTSGEYLYFVARAKGLDHGAAFADTAELARRCGLQDVQNRLVKNLSKGYRQRIGIAQALIGNPKTIILDEPTVGLDPIQIIEIRDLIQEVGHDRTVLVSSHILSEIRALCSQIVIVSQGHIVADDTPENLERLFAGSRSTLVTLRAGEEAARRAAQRVLNVDTLEVREAPEPGTTTLEFTAQGKTDLREAIFRSFAECNIPVLEMTTRQASLEDVFVELTGHSSEDGRADA